MTKTADQQSAQTEQLAELYSQNAQWQANTGGEAIVAKRLPGRFRQLKVWAMLTWLPFLLGPYLRWDGEQAVLFDIAQRQFHLFGITLYPQDLWMLTLTLLFFAMLLALITTIAGRVFCGFFCFQTIWTDIYTYIEGKCEGQTPHQAAKFNASPWGVNKLLRKTIKHVAWLLIGALTGIALTAWFTDAYQLWTSLFTLTVAIEASMTIIVVMSGTYLFAGFMREQVCLWLCPYARLQSVMIAQDTVVPYYDQQRGEPRAKLKTAAKLTQADNGSCIDCNLCVAVCPTGVDIRQGQQQGCITCGLCIDACDSVMEKTQQPTGLVRYASQQQIETKRSSRALYQRPRVWLYGGMLLLSLSGIVLGLATLSPVTVSASHQHQPLFVELSNGDIQNRYQIKVLNKTQNAMPVTLAISGIDNAQLKPLPDIVLSPGKVTTLNAFIQMPKQAINAVSSPVEFSVISTQQPETKFSNETVFIGPS